MRRRRLAPLAMLLLLAALSGCASAARRRSLAVAEPPLDLHEGDPSVVAQAPPPQAPRAATFANRHPLFTKPREYYEISGDNKLVKSAAATFIGVPAGVLGEMRQIVVGHAPGGPAY